MHPKKPLNPGLWPALQKIASTQAGLITRWQAVDAGCSRADFIRLLRLNRLRPVPPLQRGLYEAEPPKDWSHRELHSVLLLCGEGAVISHRAAGRLYQLWGIEGFPLEVILPPKKSIESVPCVVRRMALPEEDVTVHKGLRVTTLPRTLRDLASVLDHDMLAIAFEAFRRFQPKQLPVLKTQLENQKFVREGTDALLALLADADRRASRPMDSPFEVMVWRRLCLSGLPLPSSQFEFKAPNGRTYRIDFAYADLKIAIEVDGFGFHSDRKAFHADQVKMTQLKLAGWKVIRIDWERYCNDLAGFFEELRRDLQAQRLAA